MDLRNIVPVAGYRTGCRGSARQTGFFNESAIGVKGLLAATCVLNLLIQKLLKDVCHSLPNLIRHLGYGTIHRITGSISIRPSHSDDFIIREAFGVAEVSIAL
jgi:hypothetical protein